MASRTRQDVKRAATDPPANVHVPPATKPMKVTVDEDVLRRLYVRMLRTGRNGSRNGSSSRRQAELGAVIDLLPGDAVSAPAAGTPVQLALDSFPGVHKLPPHLGLAAGVALAYKLQANQHVVVSIVSAAGLESGSSHEALRSASTLRLPLVVVVDCSEPPEGLGARAAAYDIPAIAVDGEDPVAVYRVSREAINRARGGRGPSLIECQAAESDLDPITRLEHYLDKHGWWTREWKRQLLNDFRR